MNNRDLLIFPGLPIIYLLSVLVVYLHHLMTKHSRTIVNNINLVKKPFGVIGAEMKKSSKRLILAVLAGFAMGVLYYFLPEAAVTAALLSLYLCMCGAGMFACYLVISANRLEK